MTCVTYFSDILQWHFNDFSDILQWLQWHAQSSTTNTKHVHIKLADNKIVYSAWEATVVFNPIVNDQAVRPLEFSRVLHLPDLRNNLFSVLFLTRQKGWTVTIDATKMSFQCPASTTFFTATISNSNAAFLDGITFPLAKYCWISANLRHILPLSMCNPMYREPVVNT